MIVAAVPCCGYSVDELSVMFWPLLAISFQSISVHTSGREVVVDNGQIHIDIGRDTGRVSIQWRRRGGITQIFSETRLADGKLLRTFDYRQHQVGISDAQKVHDKFGSGIRLICHHRTPGLPQLDQVFWVYEGRPEVIVQLRVLGKEPITTNYLAPIVTDEVVDIAAQGPLQSLYVPYDNDMYARYRSDGWDEKDGSFGVGAIYDDVTRRGMVVGALDHEVWKSAIRFARGGGVRAYAGATGKATHDTQPHGSITAKEVESPRMVMGFYVDWRDGLECYGDLNALVKRPLRWKGGVPFGWNSWAGHKTKVRATDAEAATLFVHDELPDFRNDQTATINFDSFWDNLTRPQLLEFVHRAHSLGMKAGIYFTPFTGWSELDKPADQTGYIYRDMVLKDAKGQPLPKLDGGWPLDPTHPGTISRNAQKMRDFVDMGFDFVKLDFLSHGALEGIHFDKKITTGSRAYGFGMNQIADSLSERKAGRPVFISLSIAPLFPYGFAHSRRISCDVFSNIGATEYLLNSSTYGWWTNRRLFQFNDPDATCLYQPMDEPPVTEEESISRLTASIISGGMLLDGDDLTKPEAKARARKLFANQEAMNIARRALAFRPLNGNSGSRAGDTLLWKDPNGTEIVLAVFNFEKTSITKTINRSRLGTAANRWRVHDIWTQKDTESDGDPTIRLKPMQCAFLRLSKK